jgi:hypothetical protein
MTSRVWSCRFSAKGPAGRPNSLRCIYRPAWRCSKCSVRWRPTAMQSVINCAAHVQIWTDSMADGNKQWSSHEVSDLTIPRPTYAKSIMYMRFSIQTGGQFVVYWKPRKLRQHSGALQPCLQAVLRQSRARKRDPDVKVQGGSVVQGACSDLGWVCMSSYSNSGQD